MLVGNGRCCCAYFCTGAESITTVNSAATSTVAGSITSATANTAATSSTNTGSVSLVLSVDLSPTQTPEITSSEFKHYVVQIHTY